MSHGFRAPPTDTDLRPFYRSRTSAESPSNTAANTRNRAPPGGDRSTRAPPAGHRSSRSASSAQWSNRSSSDWSDCASSSSDWSNRPASSSDWSSRPSSATHWSSDGALSVLNSCGLDPSDLSLLAELPENMLTLKSLPHVLSQIKGHKKDILPNPPGYQPSGSTSRQHIDQSQAQNQGPTKRQLPGQSQASYQGPGQSQAAFSSSSVGIVVDYGHRAKAPDFGNTPERPLRSSQTSQAFTAHGPKEFRRSAEINQRMGTVKRSPVPSSCPPSSGVAMSAPSEKQARDFHGMRPSTFPYSCSLCDITVLSEIVWTQHINGTQHADGQLNLLQRFQSWDCRLASVSKSDSKQLMEASMKTVQKNMREKELNQKPQKKVLKGKVVCVKFPPRSVDELYLRKLIEPFGEEVNVAMFPSLGFIELESVQQAQNLISFYTKTPHTVNGQEIEFSISNTFNFLQSSFVVNFYPVPFGKEGQSDLLTVIKRFGTPLYTMFLPEKMQGFVEMQNTADAHKMVEFYSSTPLRINGVHINVSFSQEYRTLERCALAKPYEEEPVKKPEPKRPQKTKQNQDKKKQDRKPEGHDQEKERSVSREKTQEKSDSERSESRDREAESGSKEVANKTETKKATEKLSVQGQNKDESGSKGVVNKTETKKTSEKPTLVGQKKEGTVKSASKDVGNNRIKKPTEKGSSGQNKEGSVKSVSKEAVNKTETKKCSEKSNSEEQKKVGSMKSGSKEAVSKESNKSTEKPTSEGQKREGSVKNQTSVSREKEQKRNSQEKTSTNQKKEAESKIEVKKKEQTDDTQELSEEGSDIEGMQVMGEHLDDDEEEEMNEDEDEDPGFPFDLENCITLDEVHDSDEHEEEVEEDENSPRVVFIGKLPMCDYSDEQFLQMVQTSAKPVRYFLSKAQRMGLVEMQSTSEAVAFCSHMKNYVFKGSAIKPFLSDKYNRLYKGWVVHYDSPYRGSTGHGRSSSSSSRNGSESPNDRQARSKWSKSGSKEDSPKTLDKSRELDKMDTRRELTDQMPREKQSPTNQSEAVKEDSFEQSEAFDEEGWVVYDLDEDEEKTCTMIRIENVVSLKGEDLGEKKDKSFVIEEEGWLVSNEAEETTKNERVESDDKMDVEERESNKMAANQELLAKEPTNEKAVDEDLMIKNGLELESVDEEGWPVSNLSVEEFKSCDEATEKRTVEEERDEQNGRSEDFCEVMEGGESSGVVLKKRGMEEELGPKEGGEKAVKRRRSGAEAESVPEKKLKEDTQDSQQDSTDSVPTESGTTETRTPNKPIGTEFIQFYCNLCHVSYSDEHEAKVSHCSSLEHYQKYKEITGKDPWTS